MTKHVWICWMALSLLASAGAENYLSPADLDWSRDGNHLYITAASGREVLVFDTATRKVVKRFSLPTELTGLEVSRDGRTLYVTGGGPDGVVFAVDASSGKLVKKDFRRAFTDRTEPVAGRKTLYVCNQFDNDVSFIDLASGKTVARVPAIREPVAADLTPDGKYLFVANLLPDGPANQDYVAAKVTVIETATQKASHIPLANGAEGLRGLRVSPDGEYVYVTSILARFLVPATQLERGWVATDALSVIRVADRSLLHSVLLDEVDRGFPNPWAIGFTADARRLVVSAAGTHELMLIDLPAMMEKLASAASPDAQNDLAFLSGIRKRIQLPGNGPRAMAVKGSTAYVAQHFSDSIDCVPLDAPEAAAIETVELNPGMTLTQVRQGEIFFNDATECFQNWLSCVTCHPDARTDAMNWDLLNDGMGNPKNVKTMLLAHRTPPTTWLGARANAMVSVRAGFRHIQFAVRPEEDALAIDAYLKSLEALPSPHLVDGKLSPSGVRGKELFEKLKCVRCHPAPLYTDMKTHEVGTTTGPDVGRPVDTPSLVEVWRTGPYLHDGRAATIRDVLTKQGHGRILKKTANLSPDQINDLETFLLSIPAGE